MTTPSVDELFKQALALDDAKREEFFASLDDGVRKELASLLTADGKAECRRFLAAAEPQIRDDLTDIAAKAFPTLSPETPQDTLPEYIGPYRILQSIGKGGMGQVFMAEQREPVRRRVALKVIRTETPTDEVLARFEAERQALALMDHQNIARVLDAGITGDGRPYFAMELVHGVSITEYSDNNQLTPGERLALFVQTCRAIQHAHQKGIIHRDIKPSNVLVTQTDGKPVAKVIDFGLARALQDDIQLTHRTLFTQFGQVVGTLAYMSPEQAEMNTLDVDARTDVYSLGVILFELLTGSTPIRRDSIRGEAFDRILAKIREEDAPRPSSRLSESGDAIAGISEHRRTEPRRLSLILKGDLDWIAVKSLEKDRSRRYDSPAALADDVQRFLDDKAIDARPHTFGYRLQKAYRRNKGAFVAGGIIAVLLIAGLVGTGTMWLRASQAETVATAEARNALVAEDSAQRARADAESARDRAEATLARSNYFLAIARWEANRPQEANDLLDKVPVRHRHFEWRLARQQFLGSDITCSGHTTSVNCVAFSPDGKLLASGGVGGEIKIWNAVTGKEIRSFGGHLMTVQSLSFHPDSQTIVSGRADGAIRVSEVTTGNTLLTIAGHTDSVQSVSFSPDGTRIVSGSEDSTVKVWDASTGEMLAAVDDFEKPVLAVSFSPDGRQVAAGIDKQIELRDATNGALLRTFPGHSRAVTSLSFSSDGTRLVSGSQGLTIKVWKLERISSRSSPSGLRKPRPQPSKAASRGRTVEQSALATGELVSKLEGHTRDVLSVEFSPDGRRVVSASKDHSIRLWDAATAEELGRFTAHTDDVNSVRFGPRGMRFVSASDDETVRLWDSTGNQLKTLLGHERNCSSVTFSPDGARIATGSDDKTVKIWDVSTGENLRTLTGHTDDVLSVSFSPDGSQLASAGRDKLIRLWDASTGATIRKFVGHSDAVNSVCFSPDGAIIASASDDNTVKIWNPISGTELQSLTEHTRDVCSVSFSPLGDMMASASEDATIRIRDCSTGRVIRKLKGHSRPVQIVCFSPDGKIIASGAKDNLLKLWESSTGRELRTFRGHRSNVVSISFSPDGERIVCGGYDGSLKLLDASTGEELRTLRAHTGTVAGVCFSPDGRRIASAGEDDTVKIFEISADTTDGQIRAMDLHFKTTPAESAFRRFKAEPNPIWHARRAKAASSQNAWFAEAFHLAWQVRLQPDNSTARRKLSAAVDRLDAETANRLPAVLGTVFLSQEKDK